MGRVRNDKKKILTKKKNVQEKSFEFLRKVLIIPGITEFPYGPFKNILTVLGNSIQVYMILVAAVILTEDTTYAEKTEVLLIISCNLHVISKSLVLPTRRRLLSQTMELLETMEEESSEEPELRKETERNVLITKGVYFLIVGGFSCMHLGAATMAILKHLRNINTMPFQFYVPFPKYEYFYLTCLYVYGVSMFAIVFTAANNALLCNLTLNVSTQMLYLQKQLEKIGCGNLYDNEDTHVNKCIQLHQQMKRVAGYINGLYSDLLYIEYLFSSLQCCISGYQLILARSHHDSKEAVYYVVFFMALLVPIFFSLCGNHIKIKLPEDVLWAKWRNKENWVGDNKVYLLKRIPVIANMKSHRTDCDPVKKENNIFGSETIFAGAYNNHWYKLSLPNKKKLLVILCLSNETLTINYKQLITFDMEQYSLMVKTAYSLIAVVQTMET